MSLEIVNPFTPSEIASSPDSFFGRGTELSVLSRSVKVGSVVIQGPVGIGKSSLLSRLMMHLDGYLSNEEATSVICVGHRDIQTVDDAARLILERLVDIDEQKKVLRIGVPKFFQYESSDGYNYFCEGRHLAALSRVIEGTSFIDNLKKSNLFIIAIDEADKCAGPIARILRTIGTITQLNGIKNLRFVLSGVSPFYEEMISEDEGIYRFVYKNLQISNLEKGDAKHLLDSKFKIVANQLNEDGIDVRIDTSIIDRIMQLSNGHPHLIQLLGSHVIESECADPDQIIDAKDLYNSLEAICFDSRGPIYERIIHMMDLNGRRDKFERIVSLAGGIFPAEIDMNKLRQEINPEEIDWFLARNIISIRDENSYGIVDEFLRVRFIIEAEQKSVVDLEEQLMMQGAISTDDL